MDVPSAQCLIKLCNGKARLCGAEWSGACARLECRAPGAERRGPAEGTRRQRMEGDPRSQANGRNPELLSNSKWWGTRWMMNRGRFIRLVMPEPGPKVMKAEDGV